MARISVNSPGLRIFNSCDKNAAIPEIRKHVSRNPSDTWVIIILACLMIS